MQVKLIRTDHKLRLTAMEPGHWQCNFVLTVMLWLRQRRRLLNRLNTGGASRAIGSLKLNYKILN